MSFKNLSDFLSLLEKKGQLKKIEAEVDPDLEITEIADRMVKKGGPALLFENVKGASCPLVINTFASYDRMAWALGVNKVDEIADQIVEMVPSEIPQTLKDKFGFLNKLWNIRKFHPKEVNKGPCQDIVRTKDFGLDYFPVLKCWPQDGGKFITLPLVITKDPVSGKQNIGMYRLQVFDKKTTGMHWHIHHDGAATYRKHEEKGKRMEIAVALGGDPATIYAATAPLPSGFDELIFSSFLRKEPVEVVKAKTVDLLVPAEAEIILEGYVEPGERRREGPFGDHTGYYSLSDDYPVFHIQCITHRRNPIYPTTIVGRPPMEDCYMAKATERIFLPAIKAQIPEIVDLNLPLEGVFHNCAIVSIKKEFPLQSRKVASSIWGLGQMMFTKIIIIVDHTVDVQNPSEVAWKVFNNIDPQRDVFFVQGPLDVLDHASNTPNYGSKMGIDATKKWPSEGHTRDWPDDISMSKEIKELVTRRWKDYGLE